MQRRSALYLQLHDDMDAIIVAMLLALQDEAAAYQNASPVLSVIIMSIVIAIIMVCLLIIGVLSLSEHPERRNRTRT